MTAAFLAAGTFKEERVANLLDGGVPYYDIYETADGKHMSVGALEPQFYDEFVRRLTEFMGVIRNPEILADCVSISKFCMEREYYKALMLCRKLIEYEDERLGNVPSSVPTGRGEG